MYYYAFTIRYLKDDMSPQRIVDFYEQHVQNFKSRYNHIDVQYHFEVVEKQNGHNNIHMHGMLASSKKVHVRMLHPGPNCHCYFEFAKSRVAWTCYITKDQDKRILDDLINGYDTDEPIETNEAQERSDEDRSECDSKHIPELPDDGPTPPEIYKILGKIV